ncbi:type III flagellar switch regulator (C-ring) FliN [Achromobacter sp. SLBN-14]|nr:type III flagellar switch regulator (C-ring) FliN [Achromobacter sp. SLBN-14]
MTVWTIAWWTHAEMERTADSVRKALLGWCGQWGVAADALRVEPASLPDTANSASWQCVTGDGDEDGVWVSHPETAARALAVAVCDDDRNASPMTRAAGPMSLSVARQAGRAVVETLCAHFAWIARDDAQASSLPPRLESGSLSVSVRIGDAALWIVLSAGVARSIAGRVPFSPSSPLVPIQDVLGARAIALAVALRPVRLEIGSLCSLAVGDVIALDHKLDEPTTLYAEDASPVAQAHLSRIGPQKAIRLDRAAS